MASRKSPLFDSESPLDFAQQQVMERMEGLQVPLSGVLRIWPETKESSGKGERSAPLSTHPETMAVTADACRLANTMTRLTTSFQSGAVAIERMRSGGKQHVIVQHIHQHVEVSEGGQAMVAGQVKAGGRRKAGRGRGIKDEQ